MRTGALQPRGEPADAKLAAELHELDGLACQLNEPLMIGPAVADACVARWGRLPANCEVYVVGCAPAANMPSAYDKLPPGFLAGGLLRDTAEPCDTPLPAIAAQHIKPMRQRPAAQWKRERNGRRQK